MTTETTAALPEWLAALAYHLGDQDYRLAAVSAAQIGANLEPVRHRFAVMLMDEQTAILASLDVSNDLRSQVIAACGRVRDLHASATAADSPLWSVAHDHAVDAGREAEAATEPWSQRGAAKWAAQAAQWAAAWNREYPGVPSSLAAAAESVAWSAALPHRDTIARTQILCNKALLGYAERLIDMIAAA